METYEFLLSAVGSVGFPIVACCFMGWLYVKMDETLKQLTIAINTLTTHFEYQVAEMPLKKLEEKYENGGL